MKQASRQALAQCRCQGKKLKLKKIGEGRYNIHGRNVFIRVIIILLYIINFVIVKSNNVFKSMYNISLFFFQKVIERNTHDGSCWRWMGYIRKLLNSSRPLSNAWPSCHSGLATLQSDTITSATKQSGPVTITTQVVYSKISWIKV